MPELPGPPEDYDEEQRQAWLEGAASVARILGQQGAIIAGKYEDLAAGDGEHADRADGEDETCPECGGELLDSFGGPVCSDCGTHYDGSD